MSRHNDERRVERLRHDIAHREVDDFVAYLRLKGLSQRTLILYLHTLRDLVQHATLDRRSPAELTTADLRSYVADLSQPRSGGRRQGLQPGTIASHVIHLKRFFAFLLAEGLIASDPSRRLPTPTVPKLLPKALTVEQTRRLLETLSEETVPALRDKALITLLYACGLRISEAVSIQLEQMDLDDGTLRVIGKGDKERRLYLKPQVVSLLRRYLAAAAPVDHIFLSPRQAHLGPVRAWGILKHYVRKAGLPDHVSPHTLRHSVATHYLLGGAPITFVQGLLGHANLATTGRYTGLVDEWAKAIAINTPWRSRWRRRRRGCRVRGCCGSRQR